MMVEEANWLASALERVSPPARLLNLGSSTAHFRSVEQPHIDRLVFRPLVERGITVTHVDLKQAPGVDIVADLDRDADVAALASRQSGVVLCSNLLEHVREPEVLARRITSLVAPGGLLVVTVPRRFPHHGDPLDTMFRPTPQELAALFPGTELLSAEVIDGSSNLLHTLRSSPRLLALNLLRLALPWYKPRTWLELVRYLPHAHRPYQVSYESFAGDT